MLLFLVAYCRAEPTPDWASQPVAQALHPVGYDYGAAYQAELSNTMAGNRASPIFSRTVNQAMIHWTLVDATGRGLGAVETANQEWTDMALLGSFLAFNRVADDTFSRAPALDALRLAFDTVLAPAVDIVFRKDGGVAVRHPTGFGAKTQMEGQEMLQGLDAEKKRGRNSKLHLGVGWQVRPIEAPESDPLLGFGATLALQRIGISNLRTEVSFVDLHWSVTARQEVIGDFSLLATLRSQPISPEPARWSAGVSWAPRPRTTVRFERSAPLIGEEWNLMLLARVEIGGILPGRVGGVTPLPALAPSAPNVLGPSWAWAGDLSP